MQKYILIETILFFILDSNWYYVEVPTDANKNKKP